MQVWRANIDGGNPQPLSPGPLDREAIITGDGRWVIYTATASSPYKIWKVPIEGGSRVEIPSSEPLTGAFAVSPDGTQIAVPHRVERGYKVALRPIDSDTAPTVLDISSSLVRWMPDGRSLSFVESEKRSNLWRYPLPSGTPKPLTSFMTDRIISYAWSKDGKQLVLSRGHATTDVVLVTQPSSSPAGRK
jgi:Tol biopolymer transport system component